MANTNWENLPSTNTPINATNLNKISDGLVNVSNEVDSTYKTNVIHSKNMFEYTNIVDTSNVSSYSDGVITLTWSDAFNIDIYKILSSLDSSKSYTISFKHKGNSLKLRNNAVGSSNILTTGVNSDYTLCSVVLTGISAFQFRFLRDDTTGTAYIKELQIEEGSTATTYEPFTYNEVIVNGEKYTDTLNVGTGVDSRSKVNVLHSKNIFDNTQPTTYYIEAYLTPISKGIKATTPTGRNNSLATIDLGALNDYVGKKIYFKFRVNTTNAGRIYIGKSNVGQTLRTVFLDSGTIYNGEYEFETDIISADNDKPRLFIAIYANGLGNNVAANAYTEYNNLIVSTEDVPYEDYTSNQIITNNDNFTSGFGVGNDADLRNKVNFVKSRNLFSSEIRNGNVSDTQINSATNRICSKTFIKVKPSTKYVLSFSGGLGQINISYFTSSYFPRESESGWTSNFTFTTKSNTNFIMISWRKSSNNEDITPADLKNVMLNEGNTALTYQPYGTSISVENEEIYNQGLFNNDVFKSQDYIQQDLNLYTTPGSYMINNNTLANIPGNGPAVLLVFVGKYSQVGVFYIVQVFIASSNSYIRFRDTGSTSWGSWKQINN